MKKFNISHEYETDLWNEGVYDRRDLDTAWLYACLNPLRHRISRELNLFQKNFMLSPFFTVYFHLEQQAANFLESIVSTRDLPLDNVKTAEILENPVTLSGSPEEFFALCKKYGTVPLHAMPGNKIHSHRTGLLTVLSNRLAFAAQALRECERDEIPSLIEESKTAVNSILEDFLGTPPAFFNWNFKTADGSDCSLEGITPLAFYEKYCKDYTDSLVFVYNESMKGLATANGGNVIFACGEKMANAAALTLDSGREMVIAGADTRQQSNKMLGILDTDFNDNESAFGADISMSAADSVRYKRTAITDYLTLDGVQSDSKKSEPTPLRFKAQDSCGADTGADGHYTMSYDWFCKYVLFVAVDKKYI